MCHSLVPAGRSIERDSRVEIVMCRFQTAPLARAVVGACARPNAGDVAEERTFHITDDPVVAGRSIVAVGGVSGGRRAG